MNIRSVIILYRYSCHYHISRYKWDGSIPDNLYIGSKMADWRTKLAKTAQRNRLEIVKAKLSRREMVRLGLLTAGGTLIAKPGLSAITTTKDGSLNTDSRTLSSVDYTPPSPKARPWIQPMPIIPLKASVAARRRSRVACPTATRSSRARPSASRISSSPSTERIRPTVASSHRRNSMN